MAWKRITSLANFVIQCKFLTCADSLAADKPNARAGNSGNQIRVTTVIREFCTTPTHGCVQRPAIVQRKQVVSVRVALSQNLFGPANDFSQADALARVLNDFLARGNRLKCEYTKTIDR